MVMLWIKMWIESLGRLPTYLLMKGSSPNVVHKCNLFLFLFIFFFYCLFFWKKMSTRHAYLWSWQNEDFNRDLEFWTCSPEIHGFEFGRASQRSKDLNFGHASQRSDGFERHYSCRYLWAFYLSTCKINIFN